MIVGPHEQSAFGAAIDILDPATGRQRLARQFQIGRHQRFAGKAHSIKLLQGCEPRGMTGRNAKQRWRKPDITHVMGHDRLECVCQPARGQIGQAKRAPRQQEHHGVMQKAIIAV